MSAVPSLPRCAKLSVGSTWTSVRSYWHTGLLSIWTMLMGKEPEIVLSVVWYARHLSIWMMSMGKEPEIVLCVVCSVHGISVAEGHGMG